MIGRADADGVDIGLVDDRVSARHCMLISRKGGVMLKDDGSVNGTYHGHADDDLNDIMADMVVLQDGDLIKVGHSVLLVRLIDRELVAKLWPEA